MKLNISELTEHRQEWLEKGYRLPEYDVRAVAERTKAAPEWVHFGPGNIFRAFIAAVQQEMLNDGREEKGIIVVSGPNTDVPDLVYRPYDDLCVSVTLKVSGVPDKEVLGSVSESLKLCRESEDFARLQEIFRAPTLKLASFTITEKGYNLRDNAGRLREDVEADFAAGPDEAQTYMGKVASLMYARFCAGKEPMALVSMDNCSQNGAKLHASVSAFAHAWAERGLVEAAFAEYIDDPEKVGFPWSMIDKITPRPDERVIRLLEADGFEDAVLRRTKSGSVVAPFVNAEETRYLVIEDSFPNGRPHLDTAAGVFFTDRATVDKVERMKVYTCLNPLHTALAVFGCLLGYTLISEEMRDPLLVKMVNVIGYREGLPAVTDPGILSPKEFIDNVVQVRFPNPYMPDTPQRIAMDTSQKLPVRFGETVKSYLREDHLNVDDLKIIPLVFAGWVRYLMGIDDRGNAFTPSSDPLLDEMQGAIAGIRLGDSGPFHETLDPIFSNERIFGADLYAAGLGERCEAYFEKLVAGPGAVRSTLEEALA